VCDWPANFFYKQLMETYPDAKVGLSFCKGNVRTLAVWCDLGVTLVHAAVYIQQVLQLGLPASSSWRHTQTQMLVCVKIGLSASVLEIMCTITGCSFLSANFFYKQLMETYPDAKGHSFCKGKVTCCMGVTPLHAAVYMQQMAQLDVPGHGDLPRRKARSSVDGGVPLTACQVLPVQACQAPQR
jgi:hypothetical protein